MIIAPFWNEKKLKVFAIGYTVITFILLQVGNVIASFLNGSAQSILMQSVSRYMFLVYGLIFGVTVISLGIMIIVYVFRYTKQGQETPNLSEKRKKQVFETQAISVVFFFNIVFGVSANVAQQTSLTDSPVFVAFDLTKYALITVMSILCVVFLASARKLILSAIDTLSDSKVESTAKGENSIK